MNAFVIVRSDAQGRQVVTNLYDAGPLSPVGLSSEPADAASVRPLLFQHWPDAARVADTLNRRAGRCCPAFYSYERLSAA